MSKHAFLYFVNKFDTGLVNKIHINRELIAHKLYEILS